MAARMIVELANGNKVLFGGSGPVAGLSEVSLAGDVAKATAEGFKSALGSLAELVSTLQERIGGMQHRPEKVEMEFRASLSTPIRNYGDVFRDRGLRGEVRRGLSLERSM